MSEKSKVSILFNGITYDFDSEILISVAISGEKPCGGHGKCGKCKVYAVGELSPLSESEKKLLSEEEISMGIRLACCTYAKGSCTVALIEKGNNSEKIVSDGALLDIRLDPVFSNYGIAIDIGTTTIAGRLYNKSGELLSEEGILNPQSSWGADVISRIEASLAGKSAPLALSIRQALNQIIITLCSKANISSKDVDLVSVTGNTVMLYLLTMSNPVTLSKAPFNADRLFGETLFAEDLNISCLALNTRIYIPPCISAFVGADTVCALLSTKLCKSDEALLLADIGTNGEMALWCNNKLYVCSTAAGPAFEGVGISMGMRASNGAIDKVTLEGETVCIHTVGEKEAIGICGSGLIDMISVLLDTEVIDDSGYLEDDPYAVTDQVQLTGKDVRMVQLAKSAICAGLKTLLHSASVSPKDISTLYVAGGFGKYLNPQNAKKIGLIPSQLANKIDAIGNAALDGASMLLLDRSCLSEAETIAKSAFVQDLSSNPVFSENYMMGMIFDEI